LYRIAAPTVALPPIANVIKFIWNWAGPAARIAKNIMYAKISGGTGSTSDPIFLNNAANSMMTAVGNAVFGTFISSHWTLTNITAKDVGGTSAQAVSTAGSLVGGVSGDTLAPGTAVALSWQIAESYRGGKPRSYLPGIPNTAQNSQGESALLPSYATSLESAGSTFMNYFNTHTVAGTTVTLGTVSYHTSHAVRPSPLFYTYIGVRVHERLDSQRRRNGKESTFAVTP
jgi:hypothetical protein